jgi:hypothetical protein
VGIFAWDVRADVAAIADKLCLYTYAFHNLQCSVVFALTLRQFPFELMVTGTAIIQVATLHKKGVCIDSDLLTLPFSYKLLFCVRLNVGSFTEMRLSG